MTSGLVNASFSLPEWQAVKMIFFAPWKWSLTVIIFYRREENNTSWHSQNVSMWYVTICQQRSMQTASFALSFAPFVFAQAQFDPQNNYIVIRAKHWPYWYGFQYWLKMVSFYLLLGLSLYYIIMKVKSRVKLKWRKREGAKTAIIPVSLRTKYHTMVGH